MKIDMGLNKKVAIGLRKGHSRLKKRPRRPKKSSPKHPKVPPEGFWRPIFPPPGPLRSSSGTRKRPIPGNVDYSRELLRKSTRKFSPLGHWSQLPTKPFRAIYPRNIDLLRHPRAAPFGVGGFQGPAAHCRRPQETSGEKERTRAGED